MKLLSLFKPRLEKNYLRIYANIGKTEYSESEKRKLSEFLIDIAKGLFISPTLKYDVSGPGYGISKGSPMLGQRAFENRIKSKGYSKLVGLTVCAEEYSYNSMFFLINNQSNPDRLEAYFSWPYAQDKETTQAVNILIGLSDVMHIDYAYAYPTDNSLSDIGEWKIKKSIFSTSVSMPESEITWDRHIRNIKTGTIKKIHSINYFNQHQINRLVGIEPLEKIKCKDGNEIWRFDARELKSINVRANCGVIK